MSADKIRSWLIRNDLPFAYSLRNLKPEEAGVRICEKYDIDLTQLNVASEEEATAYIYSELEKRNG